MDDLGTDLILLCSNCSPQTSGERTRIVDPMGIVYSQYDAYGAANAAIRLSAQSLHRDPAGI